MLSWALFFSRNNFANYLIISFTQLYPNTTTAFVNGYLNITKNRNIVDTKYL